jgi:hypothetical protein
LAQAEANAALEILNTYNLATGACVNWGKTYLLKIGNPLEVHILGVELISQDHPYKHLGIPIGTVIGDQLESFWEETVIRFQNTANAWLKFHMSTKGRVLVANSLMMSVPRYALRFLHISRAIKERLNKAYFKLVWDNKKGLAGLNIGNLQACLPLEQGGLGCHDLDSIIEASMVAVVARCESHYKLPWVLLMKEIWIRSSNSTIINLEAASHFWF